MKRGNDKENWKETQGFAKMKGREKFLFLKKVFGNKKESNNEEGGQREREHQEGTYKGVKTWKESTDRKNEKHKYKNEDDQNGNLNRMIFC